MKRAKGGLIIADLIILLVAYFIMVLTKPVSSPYLSFSYISGFLVFISIWVINSFYLKKYHVDYYKQKLFIFRTILYPNLLSLAFISFIIYAFSVHFFSRMMVFGTIGVATIGELVVFGLYIYALRSPDPDTATDFLYDPVSAAERKELEQFDGKEVGFRSGTHWREAITDERGELAADYIMARVDLDDPKTLMLSTTTRFNILRQPDHYFQTIVNLTRVNDIKYLNKFFESVNHKLPQEGVFIGCAETKNQRKARILAKFPPVMNWMVYFLDFMLKRVFPKFRPTKKIYFFLTRGQNRVLSRAEILGRLYSCGFEIMEDDFVNGCFFFVARRIKEPAFDMNPTYGPFVKLRRIGKDGKLIDVYKFRTMHPYAEYLQEYIYKKNQLDDGGKFRDDFRVTTLGKIFRKLWLDELPMLINIFRGEMKIVGVRPLSKQYFSLYDKDLQELRIRTKPGLIPPFYADMPKTLEDIQASERKYIESYLKRPLRTDWRYFWKAMSNILFRKARSK